MRVNPDQDLYALVQETLKTAKEAKRAAEHTAMILFWIHLISWIKAGLFIVLVIMVIYFGFRGFREVQRMTADVSAEALLQEIAPSS